MNLFLIIFALTLLVLLVCFAGLGIKTLLHRGELRCHCSGIDPYSGKRNGCICGQQELGVCGERRRRPYQPLEVNENIIKEL